MVGPNYMITSNYGISNITILQYLYHVLLNPSQRDGISYTFSFYPTFLHIIDYIMTNNNEALIPNILDRLYEAKENHVGSIMWMIFLHSFLLTNIFSLHL